MSMTSFASLSVTLRRIFGSNRSTANPQKSHLALQIFVIANCRYPGPPWSKTSAARLHTLFLGRVIGFEKSGTGAAVLAAGASGGVRVAVLIALKVIYFGHKASGSNPFFAFRGRLLNIPSGFN